MNSKFKKFLCIATTCALGVSAAFGFSACSSKVKEAVSEADKDHTHTYSEEWSTDYNYHWHENTCGHGGLVKNKGTHTFVDNTCTVCGYVKYVPDTDKQTPDTDDDKTNNTPETASSTPEDTTGKTETGDTTDTTGGNTADTTGTGNTAGTDNTTGTTGGDTTSTPDTSNEVEVVDMGIYTNIVKYIKKWYNPRNNASNIIDVRSIFAYQKDDKYYLGYWATEHGEDSEYTSGGSYWLDIELASDSPDEISKVTDEQLENSKWHYIGTSGIGIVNDYSTEGGFLNYRSYDSNDEVNQSVVTIVKWLVKNKCKDILGDDFEVMYATMNMPICDNDEIYEFEIDAILRKDGKIYNFLGGYYFDFEIGSSLGEGESVDARAVHDEVAQECFRQLAWNAQNDQIQYMEDVWYWGELTDLGVVAQDYNIEYEKINQQPSDTSSEEK